VGNQEGGETSQTKKMREREERRKSEAPALPSRRPADQGRSVDQKKLASPTRKNEREEKKERKSRLHRLVEDRGSVGDFVQESSIAKAVRLVGRGGPVSADKSKKHVRKKNRPTETQFWDGKRLLAKSIAKPDQSGPNCVGKCEPESGEGQQGGKKLGAKRIKKRLGVGGGGGNLCFCTEKCQSRKSSRL